MRRRWAAATLMLVLSLPALGAVAAPPPASVTRDVLSNGIRLLVREDSSAGVVALSFQARAGSRFEGPHTAGMTNFLHRAMLRGAGGRTAEQIVEAAERIGGALDASGDVEYAEVRGTALARHWPTLLSLAADVALAPALDPEEVGRERRLILGQLKTRADTPFPFAFDALLHELYGPHPYAQQPLGRPEVIGGITAERLAAHHRAIYRPDALVLAISGQVRREEVRRLAERLFGRLAPSPSPAVTAPPAPVPSATRRLLERPAQQAQILVGFVAPGPTEREYAAAKVLAAVLGGGMAGRLFLELRDNRGLAYQVGVMLSPTRAVSAPFVAYLGTARENVTAAEEGILRELERARTTGVTPAEVDRAKAYVLGIQAMDRRTNARHAWYLAFFELIGAGWDFPDREARAVEAVTVADVRAAADRILERPTVVVLQPR